MTCGGLPVLRALPEPSVDEARMDGREEPVC
jgi:hypothetical protein